MSTCLMHVIKQHRIGTVNDSALWNRLLALRDTALEYSRRTGTALHNTSVVQQLRRERFNQMYHYSKRYCPVLAYGGFACATA